MRDILQKRLESYGCQDAESEAHAVKEIAQELILYALFESDFFEVAGFHGGTCLRIFHGLDRFSEDLDFTLQKPDSAFELEPYLDQALKSLKVYGVDLEISGADNANQAVRKRFLKDESLKKIVQFKYFRDLRSKIKVKLEVDINPPSGIETETDYLEFPLGVPISIHTIDSLFAGKCHSLLCRKYVKGRDWYDFLWYLRQKTSINYDLLNGALHQTGPWAKQNPRFDPSTLRDALSDKIKSVSWKEIQRDVAPFLNPQRQTELAYWSEDYFLKALKKSALSPAKG